MKKWVKNKNPASDLLSFNCVAPTFGTEVIFAIWKNVLIK
jgi:hypothetical protein